MSVPKDDSCYPPAAGEEGSTVDVLQGQADRTLLFQDRHRSIGQLSLLQNEKGRQRISTNSEWFYTVESQEHLTRARRLSRARAECEDSNVFKHEVIVMTVVCDDALDFS